MSNARELAELGGSYGTGGFVGMKNRIINGAMMIDQRNAGASVTNSGYPVDRWLFDRGTSTATVTGQQSSTVPSSGFANSLSLTVGTGAATVSGDYSILRYAIEGLNVADLGWGTASAQTITLSFWVRSSLTGTFGVSFVNNAQNRYYVASYTINAANTWEQKTITIAGDTSGTWLKTNGGGIFVYWDIGVGSTYSGAAGAWGTGTSIYGLTGGVKLLATSGATFYITGVQLEKGSTATSFDYRPYGTELQLCQRYYYKQQSTGVSTRFCLGWNTTTTLAYAYTTFPVEMRTKPTALEQSGTAGDYRIEYAATAQTCSSVPTFSSGDVFGALTIATVSSGLTVGQGSSLRSINSSAYLAWSAEL